jgi:hypothetical protein
MEPDPALDPDPSIICKNSKKNLDSYYFVALFDFLSLKNDVKHLQKVISRKNCVKNLYFAGNLKVNDENSRIDPDPDPLVRGMDLRIRIRIHPIISWIRNTGLNTHILISRLVRSDHF